MEIQARADQFRRWTFLGRIQPERFPLRIDPPPYHHDYDDFDLAFDLACHIADGQFIANATMTRGATDIHTLRNLVERAIRATTDFIGYMNGLGFDVEMLSAVSRDADFGCIFGPVIPVLSQRRGGTFTNSIDGHTYNAVLTDGYAQIVLANFREAIRIPADSGFFCYRAVEAMMQSVRKSPKEQETNAWATLRTALNVERSALDLIKGHADFVRHGRRFSIMDSDRSAVFQTTDEIVRRYIEYIKGGKTALPPGEFPPLKCEPSYRQESP